MATTRTYHPRKLPRFVIHVYNSTEIMRTYNSGFYMHTDTTGMVHYYANSPIHPQIYSTSERRVARKIAESIQRHLPDAEVNVLEVFRVL